MSGKRPTDHLEPSAKKRTQDRQGRKGDEDEEDSEVTLTQCSCFLATRPRRMRWPVSQAPYSCSLLRLNLPLPGESITSPHSILLLKSILVGHRMSSRVSSRRRQRRCCRNGASSRHGERAVAWPPHSPRQRQPMVLYSQRLLLPRP